MRQNEIFDLIRKADKKVIDMVQCIFDAFALFSVCLAFQKLEIVKNVVLIFFDYKKLEML